MVETDAPFLSPEPVRKERPNEPKNVVHTARFIAGLRGVDYAELAVAAAREGLADLPEVRVEREKAILCLVGEGLRDGPDVLERVFATLRGLQEGRGFSVVLATHSERLARGCDRILRLDNGRLRTLESEEARQYFDGLAGSPR